MPQAEQNYGNHRRYVPLYHFALGALVFGNLIHVARTLMPFTQDSFWRLVGASTLLLMFIYIRAFPVAVQDRVIRLEERLRLQGLAPDVAARFGELGMQQVSALRFASDAELPALARDVLAGKLVKSDDIKKAIKVWRADHARA